MSGSEPEPPALLLEFAGIAASSATVQERAAEILQQLERILVFDAGWLAVRDPEQHRHVPLATTGAAAPLHEYFARPEAEEEVDRLGLNRRRPPMLASEIPGPLSDVCAWADHLLPAGFRQGVAAGLFTVGGRHIGFLSLLSADPSRPNRADRRVVAAVTAVIADGLDRTRDVAETARIIERASAGVVLTRGGDVLPLPGLPDDLLLAPGSPILTVVADELANNGAYTSFLAPAPGAGGELTRSPRSTSPVRTSTTSPPRCSWVHRASCTASPFSTSGSWASWSRASPTSRPSGRRSTWAWRRWPTPSGEAWPRCARVTSRPPRWAPCAAGCASRPG
jgi:hypothetical protein